MEEQLVDCRPSPLLSVHGLNPALSELRSVHLNEVRLAAQYCSLWLEPYPTLAASIQPYPTLAARKCSRQEPVVLLPSRFLTFSPWPRTNPPARKCCPEKSSPKTALSYTFYSTQKCCPQKNPTWHGSTCMHSTLKAVNVSGFSYFSLQLATEAAPLHWPTTHKSSLKSARSAFNVQLFQPCQCQWFLNSNV